MDADLLSQKTKKRGRRFVVKPRWRPAQLLKSHVGVQKILVGSQVVQMRVAYAREGRRHPGQVPAVVVPLLIGGPVLDGIAMQMDQPPRAIGGQRDVRAGNEPLAWVSSAVGK